MSTKRPRSPSPSPTTSSSSSSDTPVYVSDAITDRSSIFIGHYSPTLRAKSLQNLPDIATASHKIAAWRFPSPQRTISTAQSKKVLYDTGHSDDGEANGGRTLSKLLDSLQVTGSVVVARWYGGVMLGPVRFTHMETCARNAIKAWREEEARKKRRIEEDAAEEEMVRRLPEVLEERDRSVEVLRGLLAGKMRGREEREGGSGNGSAKVDGVAAPGVTPTKKVDYRAMPKESLKRLEAARDRTIAFLLKQIDAEEEKEKKRKEEEAKEQWLAGGVGDDTEGKESTHGKVDLVDAKSEKDPI